MTRADGPSFKVYFRRRREGKTNFAKRLALVKSGKTRMVVRRSNKNILVQFVDFDPKGDKTLLTVSGTHLAKLYKWPSKRNVWTAYLAGLLAGKMAKKKGVNEFVLDMGMYAPSKGSVIFAAQKGAADAGLSTLFDKGKMPEGKLSNPPEKYKGMFDELKGKIGAG
ncbi:50S ribosomal protein L18 [Candidatus Micrarchaeota archaeon]|nr:50S ribosomal protein L18 [Candidatus Micrarchaeota archaeon]